MSRIKSSVIFCFLSTLLCLSSAHSQTAIAPSVGNGDSTSPYPITTLSNLYWLSQNSSMWSKHFVLVFDINADSTKYWNSDSGFLPIGNSTTKFTGKFHGQGHVISNLYINRPATNFVGLFGYIGSGSAVDSLSVGIDSITGNNNVGGLAGYNNGTISHCSTSGVVNGTTSVGGLIGFDTVGTVSYSHSSVTAKGSIDVGALIGDNVGGSKVSYCYATGNSIGSTLTGSYTSGGLVGYNSDTISNCYATGTATGLSPVGGLVGSNYGNVRYSYAVGTVSGTSRVGGLIGYGDVGTSTKCFYNSDVFTGTTSNGAGRSTALMKTQSTFTDSGWDFVGDTINGTADIWAIDASVNNGYPYIPLLKGSGTDADPYLIYAYSDLKVVCKNLSVVYRVMSDIDASASKTENSGEGFVPIGNNSNKFTGKFHGHGHVIKNIFINRSMYDVGLFGLSTGIIDSIGILGGSVIGYNYVGGVVGDNKGTISYCYATNSVSGNIDVGDFVGDNSGTINNCYATGSVSGGGEIVGSIAGDNSGTISNCYTTGSVSGGSGVGGVVGDNNGTINNCYAAGSVSGSNYVGGVVGGNDGGTISNCYWDKNTTGQSAGYGSNNSTFSGTGVTSVLLKQLPGFSTWDFTTVWAIRADSTYPALLGVDNAPFAFADSLTSTGTFALSQLLINDYDYETIQKHLVLKVQSASSGTTDSTSTLTFASTLIDTIKYRVGEIRLSVGDTLWGNVATAIITMVAPAAPVLVSPALGDTIKADSATLVWNNATPSIDRYTVEYTTDSTFAGATTDTALTDTIKLIKSLASDSRIFWRVKAHNAAGWGDWSGTYSFYVKLQSTRIKLSALPKTFSFAIAGGSGLVKYALPKTGFVSLKLYSINGQMVCEPVNRNMNAGYYTLKLGNGSIANGSYIAVFKAGEYNKTKMVQLTR
jgi:hypothetical protein